MKRQHINCTHHLRSLWLSSLEGGSALKRVVSTFPFEEKLSKSSQIDQTSGNDRDGSLFFKQGLNGVRQLNKCREDLIKTPGQKHQKAPQSNQLMLFM